MQHPNEKISGLRLNPQSTAGGELLVGQPRETSNCRPPGREHEGHIDHQGKAEHFGALEKVSRNPQTTNVFPLLACRFRCIQKVGGYGCFYITSSAAKTPLTLSRVYSKCYIPKDLQENTCLSKHLSAGGLVELKNVGVEQFPKAHGVDQESCCGEKLGSPERVQNAPTGCVLGGSRGALDPLTQRLLKTAPL